VDECLFVLMGGLDDFHLTRLQVKRREIVKCIVNHTIYGMRMHINHLFNGLVIRRRFMYLFLLYFICRRVKLLKLLRVIISL